MSGYGVGDLHLSVSESGEAWIVQIAGGVEVARHNPRYVETIEWKR